MGGAPGTVTAEDAGPNGGIIAFLAARASAPLLPLISGTGRLVRLQPGGVTSGTFCESRLCEWMASSELLE
eukprot:scaffold21885_cov53-Phaeocystis_antarctica.AAC.2